MVFNIFTELHHHHNYTLLEHFHHPEKKLPTQWKALWPPLLQGPSNYCLVTVDFSIPTFALGKSCGNEPCSFGSRQSLPSDSGGKTNDFCSITVGNNLSKKIKSLKSNLLSLRLLKLKFLKNAS